MEAKTEKVCLACKNASFESVCVADFCGNGQPYFVFTCNDCSLIGPYDKLDHEKAPMFFNPFGSPDQGHRFWVDGGGTSEECENFVLRDDHNLEQTDG